MRQIRPVSLFDHNGERKYLNTDERAKFALAAEKMPKEIRLFCLMLYYSGCRLKEVLNITDFTNMYVIAKRKRYKLSNGHTSVRCI